MEGVTDDSGRKRPKLVLGGLPIMHDAWEDLERKEDRVEELNSCERYLSAAPVEEDGWQQQIVDWDLKYFWDEEW